MTYQIWVMEMVTPAACAHVSTFPLDLPFCLFKTLQQWSAGTYCYDYAQKTLDSAVMTTRAEE
jgi:hypothetical protein